MSSYYMLECFPPDEWDDCAILKRAPKIPGVVSWRLGQPFTVQVPELLEFEMLETHNDRLLEMDSVGPFLITKKLLDALRKAGVDNLQEFQARIRHSKTGFVTDDYVAVNIVGLVSAADLSRSTVVGGSADGLIDVALDSVVIDVAKARDLMLFRLAENTSAIVVHEKVKQYLESNGFTMLSFVEPKDWIG